jgi:hypothetical protein
MRDLLVRYLLGELDANERRLVEEQLRTSPELRRELVYLRACLPAAEGDLSPPVGDTPSGLAERTLDRITGDAVAGEMQRSPHAIAAAFDPPAGAASWSLADMTVAAGVFLAVSMLFLPALRQSRDAARRNDCADNLRQLGTMLVSFSEQHGKFFPLVTPDENAGIFAVYLLEGDYACNDELARLLVCRGSTLAEDVAAKRVFIRVPTMAELENATGKERCLRRRLMGGSYAYQLGYIEKDRYCGIRNEGSCRKAVLADAPSGELTNLQSANHGGCGQNVLRQDGSVKYQKSCTLAEFNNDHLFLNIDGKQEAGRGPHDTVLGPSEATPAIVPLRQDPPTVPSE